MKKKLDHILLIDDNEPTNFLNELVILKMNCTEQVKAIQSGKKALEYLTTKDEDGNIPKPSLIFLDINMPGMNGWEFLEEYWKLEKKYKDSVIIVMLTTSLNPDDMEKAQSIPGVSGFKNKPLTEEVMEDVIKEFFPKNA